MPTLATSTVGDARNERRPVGGAAVEPAYRYRFRFRLEYPERIPRHGGALLVADDAGLVPVDAMLVMHAIERDLHRRWYGLHHHALAAVPAPGMFFAHVGGVVAHPENALRVLRDERPAAVGFPGGHERHRQALSRPIPAGPLRAGRLRRYRNAGGSARRPNRHHRAEETMPTVARLPGGWPVTLNALMLKPSGAGIHFPGSITARVLEPRRIRRAARLGADPMASNHRRGGDDPSADPAGRR